jgi:hypothetical protein
MFHGISMLAGEMVSIAKASLQKAITWCTTDAAGPSLGLLRGALLDLASLLLAEGALPSALACLQTAAAAGTCRDALLSAPQVLGPITATAVPAWAMQLLQGRFLHLLFYRLSLPPGRTFCPPCSAHRVLQSCRGSNCEAAAHLLPSVASQLT